MYNDKFILFFDGYCHLCDGVVNFFLQIDKKKKLSFCPLQTDLAKVMLKPIDYDFEKVSSLVFFSQGRIFTKWKAVSKVFRVVGGPCLTSMGLVMAIVPAFIGDFFYDLVAKYRYKIFGKRETCRLPTPEEQTRFLM